MFPNTPKIDSTHPDKNNETEFILLPEVLCQCNTIPQAIFFNVNINTLRHYFTLPIWNLTILSRILSFVYIMNSLICVHTYIFSCVSVWICLCMYH